MWPFRPNVRSMQTNGDFGGLVGARLHRDRRVRSDAVGALGQLKNIAAIAPLADTLRSDKDEWVQSHAEFALQQIGREVGLPAFEPLMSALRHFGGQPRKDSRHVREVIGKALAAIGAPAVGPLVAALRDTTFCSFDYEEPGNEIREYFVRETAASALAGIQSAIEPLVNALSDSDGAVRKAAASALGQSYYQLPLKAVVGALADEHITSVRNLMARRLQARLCGLDKLRHAYERKYARRDATTNRYSFKLESLDIAMDDLKTGDTITRLVAAYALGESRDNRAVQPLMNALDDLDSLALVPTSIGSKPKRLSVADVAARSLAVLPPNVLSPDAKGGDEDGPRG